MCVCVYAVRMTIEEIKTINLDELFGSGEGISEFITNNAVPLVGKLTHTNFQMYEKMNKPMLMLFLDLTNEDNTDDKSKLMLLIL